MISMREAYKKIGANYDDACARLMGEEMLARFALKFLDDESMDKLEAAMAAGDAEGAFMAAHTLKGVSQNLGFDNLYEPAVVVTEALRGADAVDGAREGMHALQQQYTATMSALREAAEYGLTSFDARRMHIGKRAPRRTMWPAGRPYLLCCP